MSQDLKERNGTLKTLIDKESNLNDRINSALETTLESAVREKMRTQQEQKVVGQKLQQKKEKLAELQKANEALKVKTDS